ncbi:hypothetical protein EDB81DRAFT_41517 [Dactylonectria macrodidyma]|uniref:Uncharacterized protein n=1 Tax=Dactylonectria macrodidyma TaxID=307937 RepID=A0A9P9FVY9_9HYPO|nr:hypothetical protein EDB81DRAFT_41517 [Dactylonectria macrodidyma]
MLDSRGPLGLLSVLSYQFRLSPPAEVVSTPTSQKMRGPDMPPWPWRGLELPNAVFFLQHYRGKAIDRADVTNSPGNKKTKWSDCSCTSIHNSKFQITHLRSAVRLNASPHLNHLRSRQVYRSSVVGGHPRSARVTIRIMVGIYMSEIPYVAKFSRKVFCPLCLRGPSDIPFHTVPWRARIVMLPPLAVGPNLNNGYWASVNT